MTVYRQISPRIRVQRGPGKPDFVSERPRATPAGPFTDSDDAPTLVEFDADCIVNVGFLLRAGAIVEVALPVTAPGDAEVQAARGRGRASAAPELEE